VYAGVSERLDLVSQSAGEFGPDIRSGFLDGRNASKTGRPARIFA